MNDQQDRPLLSSNTRLEMVAAIMKAAPIGMTTKQCVNVAIKQAMAVYEPVLSELLNAAKRLREIHIQRSKDEDELAASGATYSLQDLNAAEVELDAAIAKAEGK